MTKIYEIGPLQLDAETRVLTHAGTPMALGARGVAVLAVLVSRANEYVSKAAIIDAAWPGLVVEDGNLPVQISLIRRTLALVPGGDGWIETLARRGYRFVGPVVEIDRRAGPAASDRGHTNLPQALQSLIGRERELAEIKQLLPRTRLLTLTGTGGIGKTRLALQVAAEVRDAYRDGVWFVDLAPLVDPALVPNALARVLGLVESAGQPLIKTLSEYLRAREILLILDNCEHVLTNVAHLAETLLRETAGVTLLATSREPLRIDAERTHPVDALSLPDPNADAQAIARSDAVQLFVERARQHRPRFDLQEKRAHAVAEICIRLDGIPLALELAAARVSALQVEQIVRLLDQPFRLLTSGSRSELPRHQTLRAMLDWSYGLLDDAEKHLFARLSVFAGGWTLDAASAVCGGEPIGKDEAVYLLIALVEKSLVLADEDGDRYRMLETIREYAVDRLIAAADEQRVRERHRDHFLAMAQAATLGLASPGRDQSIWLEKLEFEQDNLRAAIAWSLDEPHTDDSALQFCVLLEQFWLRRAQSREGRKWCDAAVARAGADGSTVNYGKAVLAAGIFAYRLGDYGAACTSFGRALRIAKIADDRTMQSAVLRRLGVAELMQQNFAQAQVRFQEALAICQEKGDRGTECRIFLDLAVCIMNQGDLAAAMEPLHCALSLSRDLNDRVLEASALELVGSQAWLCGDLSAAQEHFERALSILRAIGARTAEADSLRALAGLANARGDLEMARTLYLDAFAASKEHGDPSYLDDIAIMAMALSSLENAARFAGGADALRSAFGLAVWPTERERVHEYRERLRAMLGKVYYDAAYEAGRALDPDGVVTMTREWLQKLNGDLASSKPPDISDSE